MIFNRTRGPKVIFVTGGVVSSLGKGLTAAAIGMLLEKRGLRVSLQKADPYINVDPGTMSPYQHGEVYVLDDGTETDLDLGHYERFTSASLSRVSNFTTGQVYWNVIEKERRGDYLGKTVQIVPHVTDEMKRCIREAAKGVDILICEVGGTVGDIESLPFLEAIRQLRLELGRGNHLSIHLTLLPYLAASEEIKTKPTQHSVGKLREIGIQPDILICRCEREVSEEHRQKISLFTNVEPDAVFVERDVESTIYEIPFALRDEGLDRVILRYLDIDSRGSDFTAWAEMLDILEHPERTVEIALVGKYAEMRDAYKSVYEALTHGGVANRARVRVRRVASETVEREGLACLEGAAGILVPGGFGERGIEGKVETVRHARERRVPFLGICLGLQVAVIEFARNACGLENANSSEFDASTPHPVIDLMEEQRGISRKGGTMRLGAMPCVLGPGTRAREAYGVDRVMQRHRHRYEVNNDYRERLAEEGMVFSGLSPDGTLVEMVELPDHPWFVASQFHPEFGSQPTAASPIFREFVRAALRHAGAGGA